MSVRTMPRRPTLFGQVANRIILQCANTSLQMALAYPKALIGDTIPPRISGVQTQNVAGGIKVTWTTDEFAASEVRFGTAPGSPPTVVGDPLYVKQHEVTLHDLVSGTTYYFVTVSIDRSGNQGASGEYQMKVVVKAYLPSVLRGR